MTVTMYGELVPIGGGDPIPLLKKSLRIGRRESCDIVLRFTNVSAHHCMISVDEGYWYVKDLHSRNGIKVNGAKIGADTRKRLDPGDELSVAKHTYEVKYSPTELGAIGAPPPEEHENYFLSQSLLERSGLSHRDPQDLPGQDSERYDVLDDDDELDESDPNTPV